MQDRNIEEFNNPNNWGVHHDIDTQMYQVKSEKGHKLNGMYTNRKMAEDALWKYLVRASKPIQPRGRPKKVQ